MRILHNLFKKKDIQEEYSTGQAVIFKYAIDGQFGSDSDRDFANSIEETMNEAIVRANVGDIDGHEFGEGEAIFYSYGPNADKLYEILEPYLNELDIKPIYVKVRYGEPDDPEVQAKEFIIR